MSTNSTRSPGARLLQPRRVDGKGGGRLIRKRQGSDEPDLCWCDRHSPQVSLRAQADHPRAFDKGPGTHLRARQVHGDPARSTRPHPRLSNVAAHAHPRFGAIMSAVDPSDIHPQREQLTDELVVRGSLTREGHHDSWNSPGWPGPEQIVSIAVEGASSGREN